MGKTTKGAAKTAAKIAKAKAKVARKCGKAAKCAALLLASGLAALFCGCSTTGEQPARSQTQNNSFEDCTFIIAARASSTNGSVSAEGDALPSVEWFTQTQANKGSETISPTASPTNTTDIKPQTDVNTTGGRTAGVLETALQAGASALMSKSSGMGSAATAPSGAACTDGSCAPGGAVE